MTESVNGDAASNSSTKGPLARIQELPDWAKLLLASFLSLYLELMLIRWIPSVIHIVAFFSNLVLISCFLGLGIGMARPIAVAQAVHQGFVRLAISVVAFLALFVINPMILLPEGGGDYAVNEFSSGSHAIGLPMPLVLIAVFAVLVWATIPFGQLVACYFDKLERLKAYSINIVGSLLGVVAFSLIAYMQLPPLIWFVGGLLVLWALDLQPKHWKWATMILLCLVAQHLRYSRLDQQMFWSPYYKVVARPLIPGAPLDKGFTIEVNDQFLLSGFDLRQAATLPPSVEKESRDIVEQQKCYYNFPFQLRHAKRVLIMGSGAGNDVAAALRNGAESVTAVEIDPVVLKLGKDHHPEKPYQSDKVHIVLNDARAFLSHTHDKYDLIIFATLDAHGLLSSAGNVRLDSFVYTKESVAAAKEHLTPDGLMVLSFGPFREDTHYRQYSNVKSVFGQEPLYFLHESDHRSIVAGALNEVKLGDLPKEWRQIGAAEIAQKFQQYPYAVMVATDDWPHLYIRERRVPSEYLTIFAGIALLSVALIRRNFKGSYKLDGQFFFLGSAFLLVETKSITEMSLLVGSTWQVNSLVFVVILLMILFANWLVMKMSRIPVAVCYVLLFASLAASYFLPIQSISDDQGAMSLALIALHLGVPIFLAAIIFAASFQKTRLGTAALASNLLGAVLGGLTEYLSIAFGIKALSLLALALYAASFVFWLMGNRKSPEPIEQTDS